MSLMIEIQQLIEIYIPCDLIITTIYDSILQNLRSIYSALCINLIFKMQRKSRYALTLRSTTNHSPCVSASRYAVTHRFRNLLTNIASFTESEPDPMIQHSLPRREPGERHNPLERRTLTLSSPFQEPALEEEWHPFVSVTFCTLLIPLPFIRGSCFSPGIHRISVHLFEDEVDDCAPFEA